ncbi:hypothetical protein BSKO_03867 [Bryopsis sp. KO-2023]|nr:hypothetical protein BSKO_03867 [Bryopsis sp. KO-2023]
MNARCIATCNPLKVVARLSSHGRPASTLRPAAPLANSFASKSTFQTAGLLGVFGVNRPTEKRGSRSVTQALFGGCKKAPTEAPPGKKLATFAGGCFWGLELAMQRIPGVEETSVGYTQGSLPNPSYNLVCSGVTGHTEAVQVMYDPEEVSFESLMEVFLDKTDPTTLNRQGYDQGTQYRSGVYFHDADQEAAANKILADVQKQLDAGEYYRAVFGPKVVVEVLAAGDYYIAEDYHQQYLEKGGRNGNKQSAAKGCKDTIRCYG